MPKPNMSRENLSHVAMLCIVLALGLFNLFFGEKVAAGDGLGWDGVTYGKIVRELPDMLSRGELNSYYGQRVLPLAIVRGGLQLAGLDFNPSNIVRAFELYNLGLLLIGCVFWKKIAGVANLSIATRWLGFASIFLKINEMTTSRFLAHLNEATE